VRSGLTSCPICRRYRLAPASGAREIVLVTTMMEQRLTKVEGDLNLLKWMVGFDLAATVGIIFLLLRH
jgi:hypothetical protein